MNTTTGIISKANKMVQQQKILDLLIKAFREKREVPLPEIIPLAAQYNARIFELRGLGWKIINRKEHGQDDKVNSWFHLESAYRESQDSKPEERKQPESVKPESSQPNLFRNLEDVRQFCRYETGGAR